MKDLIKFEYVLASVLVVLIFAFFFFGNKDGSIVATCKDVLVAVVFYFFGSSTGSKQKQATIDAVVNKEK